MKVCYARYHSKTCNLYNPKILLTRTILHSEILIRQDGVPGRFKITFKNTFIKHKNGQHLENKNNESKSVQFTLRTMNTHALPQFECVKYLGTHLDKRLIRQIQISNKK